MADTSAAAAAAPKAEAPKSFARRDHLRDVERMVQARWAENKESEADAPADGTNEPKFMCTFPYPYMNGRLHLGHAFTVTKAEFAAGFQRLRGKRVLFPFGFHCTGMPIQAAANKLKREYAAGVPEKILARGSAPAEAAEAVEEAAEAAEETAEAAEAAAAPAEGGAGAGAAEAKEGEPKEKVLGKFTGKKSKAVAKGTAGTQMTQFEIMQKSGIPNDEIAAFQDPVHWLHYFPPLGKTDLADFGMHVDWRRSFITTDANPYYDSFIRWQFNTLKARDKIGFGKRPTIFSPLDGQACADHDRASGEGTAPQEYTLIKIKLQSVPGDHKHAEALAPIAALQAAGKAVFFVAATLRPETMYGQTNCFLLPEGEYGVYQTIVDDMVYICSERSAKNMSYQSMSKERGVTQCLGTFTGEQLLGLPCSAPYTTHATVYTLPLLTISMKKGTGVVTSVPSDAPDDWAALRDLREKPKLREKYGLTEAMVAPDVIEIIDIPGYGRQAAVTVCDTLKIKSQNDKDKLKEAKDLVYQTGFYQGVMLVGKYAGKKVHEAKPLVRADMMAEGLAASYWEPENLVISRSGDECVVAELDQWYLKYGAEDWKAAVTAWTESGKFATFNPSTAAAFQHTLSWLQEWACSRSFGLGTKLPWDPTFVIESLSDSTIYMAYYTIAHLLHADIEGSTPGTLGIKASQLNDAVWDHIFLDGPAPPAECGIAPEALAAMKREFNYWYPMDLRVSGKDLIGNHLTMSLYNHAAMWPGADSRAQPRPDRMPQGFYCNGHVLVDGDKMSKSKGNFIMLHEATFRWSADCTRFALADAGDNLDDANFERETADNAILRLTTEEEYCKDMLAEAAAGKLRRGEDQLRYADRVFQSRINLCIKNTAVEYERMRFREALKFGFYELQGARDVYRDMCTKMDMPVHEAVIKRFFEVQFLMLAPICPHWTDMMWGSVLGKWTAPAAEGGAPSIRRAKWPEVGPIDDVLLQADEYMAAKLHGFRLSMLKLTQVKPSKAAKGFVAQPKPTDVNIFVATSWPAWQRKPLELLSTLWDPAKHGSANHGFSPDALNAVKELATKDAELKPFLKKIMPLVSSVMQGMKDRTEPTPALSLKLPFDEMAVWNENIDYVRKALDLPATGTVTVIPISDPRLAPGSDTAKELDPLSRAKDVVPLDPDIHPYSKA